MELIPGLFASQPFIIMPTQLIGWVGFVVFAGLLGLALWRWGEKPGELLRRRWGIALLLMVFTPIGALVLGIRLPGQVWPLPGVPVETGAPALMFLAAIPWVLGAGLLGPIPAMVLGAVVGFLLGMFDTHSPFTMFEIAGLALLFSAAIRQRYRTGFFRFIRHPLGAAIFLAVVYSPIFMLGMLFAANGSLALRLDYALTQTWLSILARGGEMLVACVAGEALFLTRPDWWGTQGPLLPSPAETSIQTRFFMGTVPLVVALVLTLTLGDWLVAGAAARRMIEESLKNNALMAADSLPYFLETGQSLILSMASPDLVGLPTQQAEEVLSTRLRSVPFFRQLYLFDAAGTPVTGYPQQSAGLLNIRQEEQSGIQLALKGIAVQAYTASPAQGENSAQISFLAAVKDDQGIVQAVLMGRTDLVSNPFTRPAIQSLEGIQGMGGEGVLLDEAGRILYPSLNPNLERYEGMLPETGGFFVGISPAGSRSYGFYQPAVGRPWSVLLYLPAQLAQRTALEIAVPLLVMLLAISLLAFILLRMGLRSVTRSLSVLSSQAGSISGGDLERIVRVSGDDEVGRLGQAFEQMRAALKSRLDELNRLLVVSQGVASNLEIDQSIRPILEAALLEGASLARVVLTREVTLDPRNDAPVAFGIGALSEVFAYMDRPLYDLLRTQEVLTVPNFSRNRRLQIPAGKSHPGAIVAFAIRQENHYYGVLWVAYDNSRGFAEEELRFLTTLAGEAALAATSARLYAAAEAGRQRLEAILASTPEPVMVFDEKGCLLLLNPAALQVPGLIVSGAEGQSVSEVTKIPELGELLTEPLEQRSSSREITLGNNRVYYTNVAQVHVDGRSIGRVCIMRDITHFKELDQLKSDFVSTVSHDLRSPLTLMRGYTTMLQMVGELNEQQKGYVRKITGGVDNMARLVNNLLDLGRIDAGIGLQITPVSVSAVVDDVVTQLTAQAVQKEIKLSQEVNVKPGMITIEADQALLQQALYNLVENAVKYTPVNGRILVKLEMRTERLLIQVQDSGIGVAPIDLPRLFEKFYRSGRRESYQQHGSGLGLAIVKSIAERHHGRVWVESQLGKGSTFFLELPIRQPQVVGLT
jgi:PAS domain S-box-containing protein